MTSAIYIIHNTKNGKVYIGQTVNIKKRWSDHKRSLNAGEHYNCILQGDWDVDGRDAFEFSVLEYCEPSQLLEREQFFIEQYAGKKCYNLSGNSASPRYGKGKVTRFTKAEMLEMLNKHKTITNVALVIDVDVSSVSRFCADNNIVQVVIWHDLIAEQGSNS